MEFEGLEALQRRLRELKQLQSKSLAEYFVNSTSPEKSVGFRHLLEVGAPENEIKASIASTATCIVSLVNTGAWRYEKEKVADGHQWFEHSTPILRQICQGRPETWVSSKLIEGNPFTVAFRLEAIKALREYATDQGLSELVSTTISDAESLLIETLKKSRSKRGTPDQFAAYGAAHIAYYPPTTFLTQLVVRSLGKRIKNETELAGEVESWCRRQIEHELALQGTPSSSRDPLALAYALTTFLTVADTNNLSATDVTIVGRAIDCFFAAQLEDGSWPRSKPLHHYPQFGNAYCHEYETLAQLLQAPHIQPNLIDHLKELERCICALDSKANTLAKGGGKAWASGHHPQIHGAESWSTASVFQFVHRLDRLVAEAIRQSVFRYVGSTYDQPREPNLPNAEFNPPDFLDSTFKLGNEQVSLELTVQNDLLQPILAEVHQVIRGEKLSRKTSIAAILFGPPGTSKTQLAKLIAIHLGWPRLDVDPSHLFQKWFGAGTVRKQQDFQYAGRARSGPWFFRRIRRVDAGENLGKVGPGVPISNDSDVTEIVENCRSAENSFLTRDQSH